MAFYHAMDWHEGENKIHRLTRVPNMDNPTTPGLPARVAQRVALSPTIALGTTDNAGQVWCTIWGGDLPIAQQVARGGIMGIRTQVDASYDPVVQALYGTQTDGEPVRPDPESGKMVSGLSIHLEERDRVKLFGRMLAGSLSTDEADDDDDKVSGTGKAGNAQLVLQITQSLGNCPKYLNKKHISSHYGSRPRLISDSPRLCEEAIAHVHEADVFFVASIGPEDMDCNHRGGSRGFIRHYHENNKSILVWPEYSGNNLYQTLGNFLHDSRAGMVIPNMVNGTTLYVTGHAEILLDKAASDILSKTRLAVKFTVTAARFVANSLQFRGIPTESNKDVSSSNPTIERTITDGMSPYNPRVRYLTSELSADTKISGLPPNEYRDGLTDQHEKSATLIKKTNLTPTITRYRFLLSGADTSTGSPPLWTPGQYVALDFSNELYMGYSHMRDDDPGALNDDFIRTFTVASAWQAGNSEVEFEVVVRNVGSVTRWLSFQNDRGMTKIGVRGFAGSFRFADPGQKVNVFIAAGIGITPLLGQMGAGDENLIVVWTLSVKDIGLVKDVLEKLTGRVRKNVRLFVTGVTDENKVKMSQVESIGGNDKAVVRRRRITKEDLTGIEKEGAKIANWYLCMAPAMRKQVQEWLNGRTIEFENFDY